MPTNPTQAERIERLKKRVVFPCVVAELSLGDEIRAALSRIEELEGAVKVAAKRILEALFKDGDGDMVYRTDEIESILLGHPIGGNTANPNALLDAALNAAKEGE